MIIGEFWDIIWGQDRWIKCLIYELIYAIGELNEAEELIVKEKEKDTPVSPKSEVS